MSKKLNYLIRYGVLGGGYWERCIDQHRRVYDPNGCSPTICAAMNDHNMSSIKIVLYENKDTEELNTCKSSN